ncbi:Mannan endo-1-6-alpha-mannosidase DCW1 [Penicillium antarcticum]|uniref:Mannan endo-1-6-alpha-mannosidase DCW1 n=1 Tax=Penicillium antarcticum TaxID=416450 RepID=UPI002384D556|nr:Mannan endo-1-6-alpha-mannosidase DCW1 [Penicillium antarcticum]KAJ5311933.1 Mannan endo-1-6-alpha-mannosidase DCW1 [Penicillium antarcticum]
MVIQRFTATSHPRHLESIKSAASTVAYDLVKFYTGNNTGDTPGNLPDPYYWWEAGAFFGALVNYWSYTGDTIYTEITRQALVHQAGEKGDFMPTNQTYTEGNDDQMFWAIAAMAAAERNFPNPESGPGYLSMVQAVFNEQAGRWDPECHGGLRWQIYTWNSGYNYKNSISNGGFFNMAARLARYTGNETYAEWATKSYEWSKKVGLVGDKNEIFDGVTTTDSCSSHDHNRWSYNAGIFLHGTSVMYNYTASLSSDSSTNTSGVWKERMDGLLAASSHFFSKNESSMNVMFEPLCELTGSCNVDQLSFKAYLSRWLAEVTQYAPYTYDQVMAYLRPTAEAAVKQCQGGERGTSCGMRWSSGTYDGTTGVGQQMGTLEVLQALLTSDVGGALTSTTGGTSESNPAAGTGDNKTDTDVPERQLTTADRAGAGILTVVGVSGICSAVYMMLS